MSYSSRVIQKLQGKEEIKFSSFHDNEVERQDDGDNADNGELADDYTLNKFALVSL